MSILTVSEQVTLNTYLEECRENKTTVNVSAMLRLVHRSESSRNLLNDYIANWRPIETTLMMPEAKHLPIGQMAPLKSDLEVTIHYLKIVSAELVDKKAALLAEANHVDGTLSVVQETLEMLQDIQ